MQKKEIVLRQSQFLLSTISSEAPAITVMIGFRAGNQLAKASVTVDLFVLFAIFGILRTFTMTRNGTTLTFETTILHITSSGYDFRKKRSLLIN